ncbi:DUF1056 family protein [Ammoniphilus sp. YIM 78166]|uniref:DUF1056 family protein n=1 Tax=Ammoniphilus sp. YIM 78166 TaxID=1644106 RepID=UPI00106F0DCD|nr:DUF1056 family protein [Ammoniphilus sp. YIM 78166]
MKKYFNVIRNYADDFFIISGLVAINIATFRLNFTAGLYCLGASLISIGITLARQPPNQHPP